MRPYGGPPDLFVITHTNINQNIATYKLENGNTGTIEISKLLPNGFPNLGEIKNPDGIGRIGNPYCGDIMHLYIKVKKQGNKKTHP